MRRFWGVLGLLVCLSRLAHADLVCDGVNDQVVMASTAGAPLTYPVTMTAIVKPTVGVAAVIAGVGTSQTGNIGGYLFIINNTGTLVVYNNSTTFVLQTVGVLATGKWYYLAWTSASATSHRLFAWDYALRTVTLNEPLSTNLGAIASSTAPVRICHELGGGGTPQSFLNATVRHVAFYAKDWTASADPFRAMAYLGPHAVATPTLLYNLQSVSGTTVRERQGTANTGTMTNFPATPWVAMAYPWPFWMP